MRRFCTEPVWTSLIVRCSRAREPATRPASTASSVARCSPISGLVHNGHSGRPRAQSHSVCQRRIMQRAYINTPVRAPTLVRRAEPNSICLPAASAARSLDRSPGAAHRFLIHMPPACYAFAAACWSMACCYCACPDDVINV